MEKLVGIMARIFNTQMSVDALLISSGLDRSKLPVFGNMAIPYEYWETLLKGLNMEEINKLSIAALIRYPGNKDLKEYIEDIAALGSQINPLFLDELYRRF